ncbi:hypothetical protein [Clostridium nigeriense]|uniref:hypothetical protein n=1 Tax=Clostridium nigeriense TaxID=1805470 RepID=UPI000AC97082|nr:hypothetical protein [Clostridium nigeriense]
MSYYYDDDYDYYEDELQDLREEGPDPSDYDDGNEIDWDRFENDYNDWAEESGFPN